ncbi:MAG: hypothetical protein IH899_07230 [Planctomycetes bacterium]|nr:hypothetical protein [Planctomycetota bacterium]
MTKNDEIRMTRLSLVPTLRVGTPIFDAPRHTFDVERRKNNVSTKRGNEKYL